MNAPVTAQCQQPASLCLPSAWCHPPSMPCSASPTPAPLPGDDKRVHMWELGNWKPFAKAQPLQKAGCHSIGWAPWGGTGLGLHPSLLLATGAQRGGRVGAPGWVVACVRLSMPLAALATKRACAVGVRASALAVGSRASALAAV